MSSPQILAARFARATASFHAGDLDEARVLCEGLLGEQPGHFDALHLLGVLALKQDRVSQSVLLIEESLRIDDRQPAAWLNLGNACLRAGEPASALAHFDRSLALQPSDAQCWNNRGSALLKLNRPQDALESFRRALELAPAHVRATNNCGKALLDLLQPEQALAELERALSISPDYPEALCNQGIALLAIGRMEEALRSVQRALELRPAMTEAMMARSDALSVLGRHEEAHQSYEQLLQLDRNDASAWASSGYELMTLNRLEESLARFVNSLKLRPDHANTLNNCAAVLSRMERHEGALACFERLHGLEPTFTYARGNVLFNRRLHGDWQGDAELAAEIVAGIEAGERAITPFASFAVDDAAHRQLQVGQRFSAALNEFVPIPQWKGGDYGHARLRVAYLSGDLRAHPISYLMAGVFEQHDRTRFEVYALSLRPADNGAMARRVTSAFDHFIEIDKQTDLQAAELIRSLEIDVLVDLTGHTLGARPGILTHRPAPVQIQYLGLPGTMGCSFVDYIIGDEYLIPPAQRVHYQEQIILLPHCFQANDDRREIAPEIPSRSAAGLPEQGFVFCSFNNSYKLNPGMFTIWMRLLREVPDSVLWLVAANERTRANLRAEAAAREVDPARLVFADWAPYPQHLARLKLADLFLDTLPFNAGTTASDALWAGVPLLTCSGESFAARMAGSLLHGVGMPELIARDLTHYEQLAFELAVDSPRMSELRGRLSDNLATCPLFDTRTTTRHLETAYAFVHKRAVRGENPSLCVVA